MERVNARHLALLEVWLPVPLRQDRCAVTTSDNGLALIRVQEGFCSHLYNDAAGHCTIGYGHLVHLGPINGTEPDEFTKGITKERAEELLRMDVSRISENAILHLVSMPLTQNQFDALASFIYNIGVANFADSTLRRKVNAHDFQGADAEFARWNHAGGKVLADLTQRRKVEAKLFQTA